MIGRKKDLVTMPKEHYEEMLNDFKTLQEENKKLKKRLKELEEEGA